MGKFGLVDAFVKAILSPGAEHLKVKKPVYVREMGIHLHSTAIVIHPCSYFQSLLFQQDKISRNKTKTCPRRLTAVEFSTGATRALPSSRAFYFRVSSLICPFPHYLRAWNRLTRERRISVKFVSTIPSPS